MTKIVYFIIRYRDRLH